MLPSPDALRRFAADLTGAAGELAAVRTGILYDARTPGWAGPAHLEFGVASAVLARRLTALGNGCEQAAVELRRASVRVERELADLGGVGRWLARAADQVLPGRGWPG